ncbi:MAG: transposase [Smithella sp.]|nr:transposase [Smithella sp.]
MTIERKSYSRQFKIDAVRLLTDQGYKISEAARNLDINPNVLRRWRNELAGAADPEKAY